MKNLIKFAPYIFILFLVFCAVIYVNKEAKRLQYDYSNQVKELTKIHEEELDKLKMVNELEKKKLTENVVQLQKEILKNQQDYEKKISNLNLKKSNEEKKLATKSSIELAIDLSKVTGFKVIND